MNRGSASGVPSESRHHVRFNEAPIHESGKYVADCDSNVWGELLQ